MFCPNCPPRIWQKKFYQFVSGTDNMKEELQPLYTGFGGTKWCVRCGYVTLEEEVNKPLLDSW